MRTVIKVDCFYTVQTASRVRASRECVLMFCAYFIAVIDTYYEMGSHYIICIIIITVVCL